MSARTLVSLASALGAVFCLSALARADDWPTFQHDLQRTGRSTASFDPRDLTLSWQTSSGATSMPIINGSAVIAKSGGLITSYALNNGIKNWETTLPGGAVISGHPGMGFGMYVVVGNAPLTFTTDPLYVLDAATGQIRYSGPNIFGGGDNVAVAKPAGATNPIAYTVDNNYLRAVSLGPSSATLLWSQTGRFGGRGDPTIVGNSVIVAGPGQYYAFDLLTGSANQFHTSNLSGGAGTTVVYDEARRQFYVRAEYAGSTERDTLTAYSYTDNNTITELWKKHGTEFERSRSVAIGATGKIYAFGDGLMTERDPVTGDVLRSVEGDFSFDNTPIVQDGYVWAMGNTKTYAYDLDTFTLIQTLDGGFAPAINGNNMVGVMDDTRFIRLGSPGLSVYVVPEPGTLGLLMCSAILLGRRR